MATKTYKLKINRSSINGQFVSQQFMKAHKKTTETQTITKKKS